MLASVCFVGGPLVNKMGIKWALVVGAATFPIRGASYYCNSKFGNQWVSARTRASSRGTATTHPMALSSSCKTQLTFFLLCTILVPNIWQLLQRHWLGLLVRGRGRVHPLVGALGRARKVPGALDRFAEPGPAGWGWHQVSRHLTHSVVQSFQCRLYDVILTTTPLTISLAKNHTKGGSGGVTPDTYIAFLIIECMA